jgi:hypothetical protein
MAIDMKGAAAFHDGIEGLLSQVVPTAELTGYLVRTFSNAVMIE